MQRRSTTPQATQFLTYALLATFSLAVVLFYMVAISRPVSAESSTQEKIDALSKKIDKNDKKAATLNKRGKSLSSTLAQLDRQTSDVSTKLSQTQQSQVELASQVASTKKQLKKQQDLLGRLLADQYVSGNTSTLEMLATSQNLADFFDQQAYRSAAQTHLKNVISGVQTKQKTLAKKQLALKRAAVDITAQQTALKKQSSEKQQILEKTNGQEENYKTLSKAQSKERKKLQEQQQASLQSVMGGASMVESVPVDDNPTSDTSGSSATSPGSSNQGSTPKKSSGSSSHASTKNGGYPGNLNSCYIDANAMSYGLDPWGYGCRQCVSYTAWKVLQKTGRTASYWGNAKQWPASARARGYKTSTTPRAGSVGVMTSGPYGHVVWVESVNSNGTINISQYNYYLAGKGWGYYSAFKNVSRYAYNVYIYF